MSTKVVVQQRQRLFREGLGQLLESEDDFDVVGSASTGADFLAVCEEHQPEVALLEADAVEWDAGRLALAVRQAVPRLRLLGLSTRQMSPGEVAKFQRCGIGDVLPRSAGIGRILAALRAPPAPLRLRSYPQTTTARDRAATEPPHLVLTPRELMVLNLVGAGFTSKEISGRLNISHKTVENHKQRIFGKLGVQNQAHAVSVAMRRGITRPEGVIGLSRAD